MQPLFQIIYINGPSSVGKTTLVKALQEKLEPPFLHLGIDKVIGFMPKKVNSWEAGTEARGFSWKASIDPTGHPIQELEIGPFAHKMVLALKEIVLTLAQMGHCIIIDDVAFGKKDVDLWRKTLHPYTVLWVGLHSSLHSLEEREKGRPDRTPGSARAQYFKVHHNVAYDLEFDTSQTQLEDIVQAIENKLYPSA